jgi:hypothetical protein
MDDFERRSNEYRERNEITLNGDYFAGIVPA